MNRSEWVESEIQQLYEELMKETEGGKLYGEPINIYDIRELMVMAYLIGWMKNRDEISAIIEELG